MSQIVLASSNQGKIKEFAQLFQPLGWTVLTMSEFDLPPIVEDGDTFFDNATIKAEAVCRATGLPAIADDSGLVVHYLGGAPGVHSARFAGDDADDTKNNLKLLQLLQRVPERKRQAHFTSVLAWARPERQTRLVSGRCFGSIATELRGERGFGYDPLFQVDELKQTFAEMDLQTKNCISHRSKAMARLLQLIKSEQV